MHWLLGLRTPLKPRVPFILAALPLFAYPLKLNPGSAADPDICKNYNIIPVHKKVINN